MLYPRFQVKDRAILFIIAVKPRFFIRGMAKVHDQAVRPQDALVGRMLGEQSLHDGGNDESSQTNPGLEVYRIYGPLVFANTQCFIARQEHFIVSVALEGL
jgi:MFS superfamily sulfate permease-like transporter